MQGTLITDWRNRAARRRGRRGLSVIEVVVALTLVSGVMLGASAGFSGSLAAVDRARSLHDARTHLASVLEDVAAQPYDNLLALDGNQVQSGATVASSAFVTDLTVFQAQVDLLQIRAVVRDRRTGQQLASITTLRSRR